MGCTIDTSIIIELIIHLQKKKKKGFFKTYNDILLQMLFHYLEMILLVEVVEVTKED